MCRERVALAERSDPKTCTASFLQQDEAAAPLFDGSDCLVSLWAAAMLRRLLWWVGERTTGRERLGLRQADVAYEKEGTARHKWDIWGLVLETCTMDDCMLCGHVRVGR
eukprot:Skav203985  [mRNA]  locus=scaffold3369:87378:88321:- [translate_table: standard]